MKVANRNPSVVAIAVILGLMGLLWTFSAAAKSLRGKPVSAYPLAVPQELVGFPKFVQDVEINPAEPIQATVVDGVHSGSCSQLTLFSVPDGERLVIETVNFSTTLAVMPNPTAITPPPPLLFPADTDAYIATTVAGTHVSYVVKLLDTNVPPFAGTSEVRVYADPGTQVMATFCQALPGPPAAVGGVTGDSQLSISGYLVHVLP
jgi:hypothetical protein